MSVRCSGCGWIAWDGPLDHDCDLERERRYLRRQPGHTASGEPSLLVLARSIELGFRAARYGLWRAWHWFTPKRRRESLPASPYRASIMTTSTTASPIPTIADAEHAHRRVDATLTGQPFWLRVGAWLGIVRVVGFDSHTSYDHALARGLEHAGRPEVWWFDTMDHTEGHPWHVTLVWLNPEAVL